MKFKEMSLKQLTKAQQLQLLAGAVVLVAGLLLGCYLYQNQAAATALHTGQSLDNKGKYTQAKQALSGVNTLLVRSSTTKAIAGELHRNQQLSDIQKKLARVDQLLKENKPQAAQQLLKQIQSQQSAQPAGSTSVSQAQISSLQKTIQHTSAGSTSTSGSAGGGSSAGGSSSGSGSGSGGSGSSGSGGTSSGGGSGGSGGSPSTSPMTNLSVVSFNATPSAGTASTCNINGSVNFSANGSGAVHVTWSQYSTKTVSQTDNPDSFNFSAAGTQSDSFNFSGSQGLEPGDSYRILATITSVSNPSVTVTAGPVTISSCAAPPALAAEQSTPIMSTITPGTPTVAQSADGIFPNECSVNVKTPYSVNAAGTVEAIVMVTSADSIGYTYYNGGGVNSFTGPSSATDSAYFRLPHLPSGGDYTIRVKLVEVSSPSTVYGYTTYVTSACS